MQSREPTIGKSELWNHSMRKWGKTGREKGNQDTERKAEGFHGCGKLKEQFPAEQTSERWLFFKAGQGAWVDEHL